MLFSTGVPIICFGASFAHWVSTFEASFYASYLLYKWLLVSQDHRLSIRCYGALGIQQRESSFKDSSIRFLCICSNELTSPKQINT